MKGSHMVKSKKSTKSLHPIIQNRDKLYTAYAISHIRMQSTASSARAEYIRQQVNIYINNGM